MFTFSNIYLDIFFLSILNIGGINLKTVQAGEKISFQYTSITSFLWNIHKGTRTSHMEKVYDYIFNADFNSTIPATSICKTKMRKYKKMN